MYKFDNVLNDNGVPSLRWYLQNNVIPDDVKYIGYDPETWSNTLCEDQDSTDSEQQYPDQFAKAALQLAHQYNKNLVFMPATELSQVQLEFPHSTLPFSSDPTCNLNPGNGQLAELQRTSRDVCGNGTKVSNGEISGQDKTALYVIDELAKHYVRNSDIFAVQSQQLESRPQGPKSDFKCFVSSTLQQARAVQPNTPVLYDLTTQNGKGDEISCPRLWQDFSAAFFTYGAQGFWVNIPNGDNVDAAIKFYTSVYAGQGCTS
jgi:hypothetical protein